MLPIADMRQVVAAIDDRPRHSGGGCTLSKQTPWPAAVASEMGHKRPPILATPMTMARHASQCRNPDNQPR
jgi:hypothetical protein